MQTAILAAGCFWGIEQDFLETKGVTDTKVGYTGGRISNPTYKDVCRGDTGHAEAVQVEFDENTISYAQLLEIFWNCHDATQVNRQGVDIGTQYRSAIFYLNDEQKQQAEQSVRSLQEKVKKPIATQLSPAETFFLAEDYHQKYVMKKRGLM
ncbi:MAG: peptide-methionine (S)-S-oxide reductase MsrA [Alphaproteobacteria bacterium]|nr:peptide-methionine (S)-S-oxide reductase MsrA [Alphaproteobacteria bacterium]